MENLLKMQHNLRNAVKNKTAIGILLIGLLYTGWYVYKGYAMQRLGVYIIRVSNMTQLNKPTNATNRGMYGSAIEHFPHELSLPRKDALFNITIYSPDLAVRWPEYGTLFRDLTSSRNPTSPYHADSVYQHPDFPTAYLQCPGQPGSMALTATNDYDFIANSDAVVINLKPLVGRAGTHELLERLSRNSTSKLTVVFYSMETPIAILNYWDTNIGDMWYHYMMSYQPSSDIYFPYGQYIPGEPTDQVDIDHSQNNRSGMMLWVASNCEKTGWPRLDWVRGLRKVISIDVYGKCGNLTCLPRMSDHCRKKLSDYKFYLALESVECDDYITEKFWSNSLVHGLVPIVYGSTRASYERVAPPGSFIHVSDFSSLQELADYLHVLDVDSALYNQFFSWRRKGRVAINYPDLSAQSFCKVLPKLRENVALPNTRKVAESTLYNSCRGKLPHSWSQEGDIDSWSPWRN